MTAPKPTSLSPSELGTKEYWDATYARDLTTHAQTPSHTGQDWFSDLDASSKILRYLTTSSPYLNPGTASFFDIGTGNGEMLFLLRDEGGFGGRMVGIDYSSASVTLCRKRLEALRQEEGDRGQTFRDVEFEEWDVMRSAVREGWKESFDVVLDKGTFDAISLSEETDEAGRRICEGYREKVELLIKRGGCLLVTSCNWTEVELKGWFVGGDLEAVGRVEYPVFRFGGQAGQSISTVCFQKKSRHL